MSDTLSIIMDVVQMSDGVVAMRDNMTKDELVQVLVQIGSTGRPTLMYQIVK